MSKIEIQELLNRINSTTSGSAENIKEYISLVDLAAAKIKAIRQEDKSPMLDAWLTMGLDEIRKEQNSRLKNGFELLPADKIRTEFMYSKSTVTMALTNILMHL